MASLSKSEINFKVSDYLDEGAFGKVYVGLFKMRNGERVKSAVKVLPKNDFDEKEFKLQAELSSLPRCEEHVACLYSIKTIGDQTLIAMEYIDGGNLKTYLEKNAPLTTKALQDMFHQLINGLKYMHSHGIAHLDIKMENIMVERGNPPKYKFIDFGFACKDDDCFGSDMSAATPFLSPPEYYNRAIKPGTASSADIWALGSTLLEVLLNNKPDSAVSLQDANLEGYNLKDNAFDWRLSEDAAVDGMPENLVKMLATMMRINPKDRRLP